MHTVTSKVKVREVQFLIAVLQYKEKFYYKDERKIPL